MNISRRSFLKGVAGTVSLAALSGITKGSAYAEQEEQKWIPEKELECDILVVGAGGSGLAACVEAGEAGANVICIEGQAIAGGGEKGVEGCFGIGSQMQKERGIEISMGEMIRQELTSAQFRNNSTGYIDLIKQSGSNIDWLIEHGVQFGDVNAGDRANPDHAKVFHHFASGAGMSDYVVPMAAAAEAAGVQFLYETKGQQLIKDDSGRVTGIFATDAEGKCIRINASSVIVATGGFADYSDYLADDFTNMEEYHYLAFPGNDGSGHRMVTEAGGASNRANTSYLTCLSVPGLPGYFVGGKFSYMIGVTAPYAIWINEDGVRFVNEDFSMSNPMLMDVPARRNKTNFIVMDQNTLDLYMNGDDSAAAELADGIESGAILTGNTVEELAEAMKVDPATLKETVEHYNASCETGDDDYYGKSKEFLLPLTNAPYYAFHVIHDTCVSIGSVKTNNRFQAVDQSGNAIEGLYVVGVEGTMLWSNVYTMEVAGSCNANNVNSGRRAAQYAVAELGK